MNVVEHLKENAGRYPDKTALIMRPEDGGSITYGALWDKVCRFSHGVRMSGIKPGDRAICMIPMSIDLYVCLLGLLKAGAAIVFVDPWIKAAQIAAFAAYAEPSAFIGIPKSHILRLLNPSLMNIRLSVTTGSRFLAIPARRTFSEMLSAGSDTDIFNAAAGDTALITFTSGSSGTPKGANRTHGFLDAQHQALKSEFPYRPDDIDMPMFPVFALNNLATGITSVVPDMDFKSVSDVKADAIRLQMRNHSVTTCTASPPFFDRLAEHVLKTDAAPALRRIMTGGAPVSDRQLSKWHSAFPNTEITVVYGSTEAEPVAHIAARERLAAGNDIRPRSPSFCAGKPASVITARVIRISSQPVAFPAEGWSALEVKPGEIGELVVTGAHVCKDYFRNKQAGLENKIVDEKGVIWHRMGDTGYFDATGRFWIAGRVHSTINRNGELLHPQLIEQAVAEGTDWQVGAVGITDGHGGQKLCIAVYSGGSKPDKSAINDRLSAIGIKADSVILSDKALPVDPRHNSKIDYNELRKIII